MRDFARETRRQGLEVELIGRAELAALARLDALLIRDLTSPRNHTYQFASRAEELGIPVLDDARSILHCSDKHLLHELLTRERIPAPRTVIVLPETPLPALVDELGLPLVLKVPEGSFSDGVERASSLGEIEAKAARLRARSPVLIAQEYLPTAFDWRIGVLAGEPLFACRYHMAPGHWQIVNHDRKNPAEGQVEALPWREAPGEAVRLAVRAASLMGEGLYGVDIKQCGERFYVIEVNDNPDLHEEDEASAPSDRVWERIAGWFAARVRGERAAWSSAA